MGGAWTNGATNGASTPRAPLMPSRIFAGKRLVVVGGTGFLGKVWVAMLLDRFPEIAHLYLLVRAKEDQSAAERFWSQIATSPVFDPLRERYPGPAYEAFLRDKVTPMDGDVGRPKLGLDARAVSAKGPIAAVVNVAGVVDFNPPLDEALEVNAFGVNNLVDLARDLGAPVMHTSTCYVAGYREGLIEEADPREIPFPRATGQAWYGGGFSSDTTLDRSHWDPQREIAECLDLVKQARHRCDDAFRQSAFLDQAKQNLLERGEPCRGQVLDGELAKVKRKFIDEQLIAAGQERALFWGWSNIYTYTKSIGEQVLAGSGVPFAIVRPAVIESSCLFPFVGWNEGINTSAPLIYMALKGQVQFPGDHRVHLDIIPVDMVASGMMASLAELIEGTAPAVYQYGTSDTNPCRTTRYLELIGLYKRRQFHDGKRSGLFELVSSRFEPRGLTRKQYESHAGHAVAGAMRGLGRLLSKAALGPAKGLLGPAADALDKAAKQEDKQAEILDLFLPFITDCDFIFSCANTRAAIERMPEGERARFYWEPELLDWRAWMYEVHLPGLEKWVVPLIEERLTREQKPLRRHETLLDLVDDMAERHDLAVALQYLEGDGLTRITYRDLREATFRVARHLVTLGVAPGDRVIVSGYNRPAWPMAYLGVLRAGAVAVPVDPQLEGAQLANIVRSSGAHVALWGEEVLKKGGGHTCRVHPDLRVVDLATIVDEDRRAPSGDDPSASDALAIPGVVVREGDVASIIYTSGTTGEPKGVMLSHANFTSLLASLAPLFPLTHKDRVLSVLPLHHTFEFTCGLLLPLSRGARILYLGEISPERLNDGLTKGRITAMVGVPALWQLLERRILARVKEQGPAAAMAFDWAIELNRLVGRKLGMNLGRLFFGTVHDGLGGHVRHLISGGAALPKDTAELFAGLGLPLSEGYGLTEASPVLTVAKASVKARPGHVGTAIPGVEVKIQSPDDRGVGEIVARGPNVMLGYANNPEATAQAIDDDGWLHTGDLGKMEKGRLVIVGRRKETIVSASGENVYPDDVETSLGSIDGVREYAIVGIDDPRGGERVACLAVPEPDDHDPASAAGPMSGFDLEPPPSVKRRERHERAMTSLRAAFQRLPRSAQPAVVHLYDADLPRTATRKVTRSEVKVILGRLVAASAPPSSAKGAFEGSRVRHAIATIANRKEGELRAETSLRGELGFDSLLTMELSVALEPLAGALDTEELGRCETVADVERLAGDRAARSTVGAEGKIVEKKDEPIVLPAPVAEAGKRLLGAAQMGFYDKVMSPKVYGRAFIPHNRNTLVASNHASHLDMGFVKYALGTYGEGLVSLAAQDYFFEKSRAHRTYFTNFTNLAAFDRKGGLRQALRQAGDLLESGKTLLIFPEGTRSTDGQIHDFKPTIGHLALANEVDILPVYLGGTYESWPKGSRVPTKREIVARIGPPLTVADLRRLTRGMSFTAACRKAAELTREAVLALRDGKVLDLSRVGDAEEIAPSEPRLAALFRELQAKYVAGRVAKPITYYFSLGASDEAKWTLTVEPERCEARVGKPPGSQADCVLKTSEEIFMKIVREAYTPSPLEFMSGAVKSNDISLLQTFQKAFDLA